MRMLWTKAGWAVPPGSPRQSDKNPSVETSEHFKVNLKDTTFDICQVTHHSAFILGVQWHFTDLTKYIPA